MKVTHVQQRVIIDYEPDIVVYETRLDAVLFFVLRHLGWTRRAKNRLLDAVRI